MKFSKKSKFLKPCNKIFGYIYSLFYYDFSIRRVIEFAFPIIIVLLFIVDKFFLEIYNIKYYIIFIFIAWAGLALIGFFIPFVKENMLILHPSNSPEINKFPDGPGGIPIEIIIKARGGFIAGRKIRIKASVKKFDEIDTLSVFKDSFDEFSLAWFNSFKYPIELGERMGVQSAGGVEIKPGKLNGRATIIFNSRGEYSFKSLYRFRGEMKMHSGNYGTTNDEFVKKINISPSENYITLRNFSINYSLMLIVLLLTIIQLKILD
ncbi:MAG: hypothetical protein WC445_02070 [Patescibacteria group bacterium]